MPGAGTLATMTRPRTAMIGIHGFMSASRVRHAQV
jgi:hypothetical protein